MSFIEKFVTAFAFICGGVVFAVLAISHFDTERAARMCIQFFDTFVNQPAADRIHQSRIFWILIVGVCFTAGAVEQIIRRKKA